MARTVEDLRLLLRVIAGPDDGDPFAAPVAPLRAESPVLGVRIGLLETDSASADPATREAVASAVRALERAGAVVEPLTIDDFAAALRIWQMIFCSATEVAVTPVVEGREADLSPIFRDFLAYARQLQPLTAASLLDGLAERDRIRTRVLAKLRPFRALLAPVSSGPAFRHGEGGWGDAHAANYIDTMRFSQFANIMGLPAASVPAAMSADGLPIGVQVIAAPYEEASVLDVAAAIEAASGMSERVPMWAKHPSRSRRPLDSTLDKKVSLSPTSGTE
jgi:amidase